MKQSDKLKIFISYSHSDEKKYIDEFRKHIAPLKNNDLIDDWYDRKIIAGQDFQDKIENNLENADIICLFISANVLLSKACLKEKRSALELKKKKGVAVLSIVLSPCGWKDDDDISSFLVLPTDGKSISEYASCDEAWHIVYNGLKKVIEKEIKIKNLKITEHFLSFLQNTDLLAKAHSHKEKVFVDDIFVYPEVAKYNDLREYEKKINSKKVIETFFNYSKILIAGENQSGKTTLCKKIFIELKKNNYIPVYISGTTNYYKSKIDTIILNEFNKQYDSVSIDDFEKDRVVPILDDFHNANNKESHIRDLKKYINQILIVDDIFSLNIKDENLINSFKHFKIKEYIPSLRNQLIKKWILLTDKKNDNIHNENEKYKNIDSTTELVNTALGKVIGKGIMPAYPFFILSVIITYDTVEKKLDQEITSQGYCYQALIYIFKETRCKE